MSPATVQILDVLRERIKADSDLQLKHRAEDYEYLPPDEVSDELRHIADDERLRRGTGGTR